MIEEYLKYRSELLEQSKDDQGFVQESLLLSEVLPSLLEAKLVDSEDYNGAYYIYKEDNSKANAYQVNESSERLLLFIVDENSIDLSAKNEELLISTKSHYDDQFKRATRFINKAIKGHLNDEIQDSHPARPLISHISSSEGPHQFDVVEIFLISGSATVSISGASPQPKRIEFKDEGIKISYQKDREKKKKEVVIKKRLIDLNFLYNVLISQGNREPLIVNFEQSFGESIEAIKAADESNFESYLCVLPAKILAGLYKDHSTRLLEKNVRSFLQFRGVNKGIRETIKKEPEKFIAYNNGLTITATEGDIHESSGKIFIKSLKDFQIVNGGQTTATIYFTQKDGFDIDKINIMAKINVAKKSSEEELEELISNISTYSNAQSRVSKVDLRSRNPQLVLLKSLTESVVTPSGMKWFFERAKGEFSTKLRIAGSSKSRYMKEFPNERRFSKEQLAKYYSAWGDRPYMVKKGGEKVFRNFIEELTGEEGIKKPIKVDRLFYEELIAKMILFRKLEKIYGQGKNSMGQIRSAVIPYTISVLYSFTDGNKKSSDFDLSMIWKAEGLEDNLMTFLTELLKLVNELIKKYSLSDDLGEFSKKEELWDSIINCKEIESFMSSEKVVSILSKYSLSEKEAKKRLAAKKKEDPVDFSLVANRVAIHTNGESYYRKLTSLLGGDISASEDRKLSKIIASISTFGDLDKEYLDFEKQLINKIRIEKSEIFDSLPMERDFKISNTLDNLIKKYNTIIDSDQNLESEFDKIEEIAVHKKCKFTSVIKVIANQLSEGTPPTIKQLEHLSYSLNHETKLKKKESINIDDVIISDLLMRGMIEWDSNAKTLSDKETQYVADFAFGLKKLNDFHMENIRRHLKRLIDAGFIIN